MGSLNKEGSLTFKLSKLGRVTTTPPPPYPKEGYLPTPPPPPDIGRGLNRTYSVLRHYGTLDPSKGRGDFLRSKVAIVYRASPAIRQAASPSAIPLSAFGSRHFVIGIPQSVYPRQICSP